MNCKRCAPATLFNPDTWGQINWLQCEQEVRKLQARIVKAQKEGRYGKVNSLQWLLTHSFSAKALAVKRVTSNRGSRTSGVDKVLWKTPRSKQEAIGKLNRRGYQPQPLKRVHIRKSNGKLRPLGIPTMKDRAMQALYLMALEPIAETTGDTHSYGFRKKRSTWDAIEQCFKVLAKEGFAPWILEGDIKGCFDHISHEWLESHIPTDKLMLHKWLKSGYILQKQLFATEEGTPQGGIISPTLANMTLDGLQKELSERFKKHEHKGQVYNPKVHMVRYADDFIITASTKELLEEEVMPLLTQFLEVRGLTLSAEKTKITHIQDGFGFLGFNIRKYRKKLLIKPDKERCKKFLENVHNLISENRASTQEMLIYLLNPKIRGWGNYYRYSVASETFRNVDHQIHIKLWRWAKRRHPKKGNPWIVNKYYHSIGTNNWCFSTKKKDEKNKSRYAYINLRRLTEIKILKHIKVKHDANPFDPAWDEYFEKRETQKMLLSLKGQNRLLKIGRTQEKKVSKMRRACQ